MDSPRQAFARRTAFARSAGCRLALAALGLIFALPEASSAQYFGRNKVQYEQFDFKVLATKNWEIHYYPEAEEAAVDMARMAERWYERFARAFQHEFDRKKPLIIYADHPDFQQTNTLSGTIGQGTGGVTESLKNRVIMPLTASYRETDRILGHELVHAFQYNIAQGRIGGGIMSLARLPLWVVEGMAEYMSLGREHPHTAMWLRDHILRDDKPTLAEITRNPKYFAYRFGQGLMSYLGGTYGDDAVQELYRTALQTGWEPAIERVFDMPQDSLAMQWWEALEAAYLPLMAGRTEPYETGDLLLCVECGAGRVNVAPSISPDGRFIVFQSEKDLFSMDLFLADVETGRILRPLQRNQTPYIDGVRYIDTSGSWSPDSRKLAFVIQAGGDNQLAVLDVQSGDMESRLLVAELGAIQNPAWSPDGSAVAFTGAKGGRTDLYLWDIASGDVRQLTNDKYADLQPAWSPDGKTLVFVSDRANTDFSTLTFGNYSLAFLDVETLEVGHRTVFAGAKHTNPVFDQSGEGVFFVSDADGFPDIYHMALAGGDLLRITRTATGVSGITMLSPAFSYSPEKDLLAFSIFHERGYIVNTGTPGEMATSVNAVANADGRMLPPKAPAFRSRVATYLDDSFTGLAAEGVYSASQAEDYSPSLQLDYVGQPSLGIGADTYGTYVGGGTSAFFTDMLGNRFLGVALNANGTLKDIGGRAFFMNQKNRWNWGAGIQHTPYLQQLWSFNNQARTFSIVRHRIFVDAVSGIVAYPLSSTRRLETGLGFTRYTYDLEQDVFQLDQFGRAIGRERVDLPARDPLNLANFSLAFVGDNSFHAFIGPVRGHRFRLGAETAHGTVNFQTLTADYRHYFNNGGPFTLAARAWHLGRYGDIKSLYEKQLNPFFIGYETLIRGYAADTFSRRECSITISGSNCPEVNRLYGHRLAVANVELRFPFTGVEEFGFINFPYIPIELTAFSDIGMAWDSEQPANWRWSRDSPDRIPVASSGFSARFNILGVAILEAYYAYPWQRPSKGWHWGFHLAPAW